MREFPERQSRQSLASLPLPERINPGDNLTDKCPRCGSVAFSDMSPSGAEEYHLCKCECGMTWHYIEGAEILRAAGMTP